MSDKALSKAPAVSRLPPNASSDQTVEVVVQQLNKLCRETTFEFTLAVGALILEHLYGGDLTQWRSRDPTKTSSLRKLARHPHLPMSPASLYRCMAIYELCERLEVRHWRHISTSHVRLVLHLNEPDQVRLLESAESQGWSVRRLDEEVAAVLSRQGTIHRSRGGPRRRSRLRVAAKRVSKSIDEIEECIGSGLDLGALSPESVRYAIDTLQRAADLCVALERRASEPPPPPLAPRGTAGLEMADSSESFGHERRRIPRSGGLKQS